MSARTDAVIGTLWMARNSIPPTRVLKITQHSIGKSSCSQEGTHFTFEITVHSLQDETPKEKKENTSKNEELEELSVFKSQYYSIVD